jgi:hypothetical protein
MTFPHVVPKPYKDDPALSFKVTHSERTALRALAQAHGMTLSALIRVGLMTQGFQPSSHRGMATTTAQTALQ